MLAAFLLASGSIGVGGFAVVIYAVSKFMLMTEAVTEMFGESYRASATAAHFFEFLERDEGRPMMNGEGSEPADGVTARAVAFTYPGTERAALSEINLEVTPGTTLALVGANGAGKTTLAKLLLGLYVPSAGRVARRGVDTREAARSSIRAGTSAVFQNYQRYQMSLRDNVILADTEAGSDEERVLRALRDGGVPEELWRGPDGLDVMLSREFGTRDLSLGQWQRLAIARGLFREHDTILLDEPTASIDPLEEQAVYQRFMKIAAGRTAIIVTHRLASARLADRILVLDGGRIVEDGTHEQLLARRGLYHRMFTAQAAWYRRN
ncbi:MAG: ABC transporter ATP-binding protein [Spirochaetaceae bacterium]|nr:ABC transporter ATP-binding protein [Spirochaetaceae bacterium]